MTEVNILELNEALRKRRDELFAVSRKTAEGFKAISNSFTTKCREYLQMTDDENTPTDV